MVRSSLGRAAALLVVVVTGAAASAQVNVALNRPVTLVAGAADGEALSTLTDGLFLPREQQWQTGTVWWQGIEPVFEIDLGGVFVLDSAIAQVDDNDSYLLLFHDIPTDTFLPLWNIPNFDSFGSGMQTRPNPEDDTERFFFPAGAVSTDRIRLLADAGDGSYSAAEVQVFAVPTPGAAALMGLGGLVCLRRRR